MLAVFFRRKRRQVEIYTTATNNGALGAQNGVLSTGKLYDYSERGWLGQTTCNQCVD